MSEILVNAHDNVGVIRRGYEAHARGDFAAVFATLDPEIEIFQTDLVPWGGSYRGHAQARGFFQTLGAYIESQVTPCRYVEAGDQVAVIGRVSGHVRSHRRPFDLEIVHVWTVKDRLATRFEAYIDTPGMLLALRDEAAA